MDIKQNSPIPLYKQIENIIKKNIKNNTWEKNSKIPSEKKLMAEYEVSRGTIKRAITNLVEEGFLIQKQGLGTFVLNKNYAFPLTQGLHSFYEYMKEQNISFETTILEKSIKKPSVELAKLLGIETDEQYLYLQRIRTTDNETIMLIENNINFKNAPEIETANFTNQSLFGIIEEYSNSKVSHSETRFAAIEADKEKANHFDIKVGAPLLFQEQVVHLENSNIIEVGRVWLKSNRFYLGTILQRN